MRSSHFATSNFRLAAQRGSSVFIERLAYNDTEKIPQSFLPRIESFAALVSPRPFRTTFRATYTQLAPYVTQPKDKEVISGEDENRRYTSHLPPPPGPVYVLAYSPRRRNWRRIGAETRTVETNWKIGRQLDHVRDETGT